MMNPIPSTIDDYIAQYPPDIREKLSQVRHTIREAAPLATEKISWGMPTFALHGNLVHFSAQKKHIGLHPAPSAIEAFQAELTEYSCSKGTVQLPYVKPLPLDLIRRIVAFRVAEQLALEQAKKISKPRRGKTRQD